eukprot:5486805-Ditylum_brightwellii.AAC.1
MEGYSALLDTFTHEEAVQEAVAKFKKVQLSCHIVLYVAEKVKGCHHHSGVCINPKEGDSMIASVITKEKQRMPFRMATNIMVNWETPLQKNK